MIPLGSVNWKLISYRYQSRHVPVPSGCLRCMWMMAAWSDSELFKVIDCWEEEGIQEQLEGSKCNKHVYKTVSKELWMLEVVKTADQCCTKMKKLKLEYRKAKDRNGKTGRGRCIWKFY